MITKRLVFASAALAAMLFAYPQISAAQKMPQIEDQAQCAQSLSETADAATAKANMSEDAAKQVEDLLSQANESCESSDFPKATAFLMQARGIIDAK